MQRLEDTSPGIQSAWIGPIGDLARPFACVRLSAAVLSDNPCFISYEWRRAERIPSVSRVRAGTQPQ